MAFLVLTAVFFVWKVAKSGLNLTTGDGITETVLFWLAMLAYAWIAGGMIVGWVG
ncbi:hypothetical protein [Parvularcula oceani]|uniref:hypothetical protein n=1 Tax=Parvularcula oceani TaxID=1247963 RepID=UPI00192E6C81|nr:hypothetical protein [Parvularcula oceani]